MPAVRTHLLVTVPALVVALALLWGEMSDRLFGSTTSERRDDL